jgi:hypothetical protein
LGATHYRRRRLSPYTSTLILLHPSMWWSLWLSYWMPHENNERKEES